MTDAKELIKAKSDLEHNIYIMLKKFEIDTKLKISNINIEKNDFGYPNECCITDVHLEVKLP